MKNYLIVVAAGTGSRMRTDIPKQFLPLHGKPVIVRTISRFLQYDPQMEIIVVLREEYFDRWNDIATTHFHGVNIRACKGGSERYYSVQEAMRQLNAQEGIVAIHDAVRPLVGPETIERCFHAAVEFGNAIPVVGVHDSLRQYTPDGNRKVNRNEFCIVQTPQCFDLKTILPAFESAWNPSFTDDASVLESTGAPIHLVEGNYENIKITTPADLQMAHALWKDV